MRYLSRRARLAMGGVGCAGGLPVLALGTCLTAGISRAAQSRVPCRGSLQYNTTMYSGCLRFSDAAKRDIEVMDWRTNAVIQKKCLEAKEREKNAMIEPFTVVLCERRSLKTP
ncbi:uncharacterized protein TrAFT101_010205 [Trichoderma asperellum]|uniref:uncharacterized protein n=1 Tax=Trichoderma asperellum TaxID=101201 RepID=UPI0033315518|nr:hypothetical protein TrAFT101_010205 [Trichoderma asperellum]